ncbi:hypothetical protein E9099_01100 [Psychroserpens sp. NJDZ02]|nr:hypothetical protein E9099_01100 [Psychroserpens sp. NJDZ02]
MENKKAIALVNKILKDLDTTGINTDALIEDIKALREYTIEREIPLAVKVLRYTYEHIEENDSFLIAIPEDTPLDDDSELDAEVEETEEEATIEIDPVESLKYVISLIKNLDNSMNILDLKYYKKALTEN